MCSPLLATPRARAAARRGAALLAAAALLLAGREAAAESRHYISPGVLAGFSAHLQSPVLGALGGEVSYTYYPFGGLGGHSDHRLTGFGVGAFAQAQSVGFNHFRFAAGPQLNYWFFGAELGAFIEEGSPQAALTTQGSPQAALTPERSDAALTPRATTFGLQVAPFVSIGLVSLSLRMGIPLAGLSEGQPYRFDIGMMGTIKLPLPLDKGGYFDICGIDSPAKARRAVAQASMR